MRWAPAPGRQAFLKTLGLEDGQPPRPKVACEGIPGGKVRKVWGHACLLVPKRSLSWTPAPPISSFLQ